MGVIQSVFCSLTFCVERVLTWTCCAFVLMLLMFTIVLLMIYGISVGYHYAQKEMASFAMSSRSTTESTLLRSGPDSKPVVRLVAVNRSQVEHAPHPMLEVYQTKKPGERIYIETSETAIVVLETERPPKEPELSPHEKDLARRLIGRFRRSRNNTTTAVPFLRPLRISTQIISVPT
ncbi:uncharacterized protein LOC131846726 [Achroia grisella]|uniref:uncharacterized protein LOC131846726 n=1 Tax=Achroia grisella TaxID=688607 RepID=UPI0027D2AD01|nr:uncharacterized protein LOC131846726 [Achroia grisella]XP_059052089.1 uncharacterized protein LOC131846726 [Achroia grisella]XP_059052091.1 uncharacterized protein LOC131846726 [Achroia grisella]